MKVAVYTIALNEEKFVQPWFDSAKDADYLLIADTGSTDGTIKVAKTLGIDVIEVAVKPWRFDMARNASLAALPPDVDYCIALDMDEILLPGWRKGLEEAHKKGVTRPRYQYTWSWKDAEETDPGLQYGGDKIHTRFGYRWKHPVHEVLVPYGDLKETQDWAGLEIHHHADSSKPRSQYLPLLAQAVQEDPEDDRNAFYYARELYFYGRFDEALKAFQHHLDLKSSTWGAERAASFRYMAKINKEESIGLLEKAINESPERRESWVSLAEVYYLKENWEGCLKAAESALNIKEKPLDYLCEEYAWGALPYDLAAISAYNLKKYSLALEYGRVAVDLDSTNQRLLTNLAYYLAAVPS
jgi:tetratricopeptide (TPR) repeat protein